MSPITGLISALIPYRKSLNVIRFAVVGAVVGAVYSLMLGFPWLFILFGMMGWNIPRLPVRVLYGFLFAMWFWFGVMFYWTLVIAASEKETHFIVVWITKEPAAMIPIVGWFVSLAVMRRTRVGRPRGGHRSVRQLRPADCTNDISRHWYGCGTFAN